MKASRGSTGNTRFSAVPSVAMPRSAFDRSRSLKTTFDSSYIIPMFVDEALPGDTINLRMSSFIRMATPLTPIMDNIYVDTFFFSVPNRLLWENWQRFMGERDPDPDSSIDYSIPQQTVPADPGYYDSDSLQDYLGLPTGPVSLYSHSALPLRAYNLIYNEWFRDENLVDSVVVDKGDSGGNPTDYVLLKRGKRKDYFTGALPFAQKGDPVELPLGSTAPIIPTTAGEPYFVTATDTTEFRLEGINATRDVRKDDGTFSATDVLGWGPTTGLEADLSAATASTVNAIRLAFQTQKFLERDARGGTRYTELVKSHFGVVSPDARLQRPEYLGGGTHMINIHPVQQTAPATVGGSVVGDLAAFGTGAQSGQGFNKSFTEHCTILGLICVRADLTYQQGLERFWSRETRYDFYWPSFAHLGEQEIKNKELLMSDDAFNEDTFGYQERYAEYRYAPSKITGGFRSNYASGSLDVWHLSQDFATRPALNQDFIEEDVPISRVVAVDTEPEFLMDAWFSVNHVRPMPAYGVPGFVDHF